MDLPDDTSAGLLASVAPGDNSPPLTVSEAEIDEAVALVAQVVQ